MIDDKIKQAEKNTNSNPTQSQKDKGNYKKGKVKIKGLQITIENPVGSTRSGTDNNGKTWEVKMPFTYGYFNSTLGKDGDQVDVYLGTHLQDFDVYIIDQVDEVTKAFDEHKIMFGFKSQEDAKESYLKCYEDGWKGFGSITKISLNKFKIWLKNSSVNKYPANKLNFSSRMDIKNVKVEEKISLIKMFGEVESGKTLQNLKDQAGDPDSFDKLIIQIASPGGSVSEGLEIMFWLNSLSEMGKQIITIVVANAYSIASLIMLAANIKLISKHGKVMVHNPMLPELKYVNANDLEKHIMELRELETSMYDLYKLFTGLDESQIKELMDKETYLSPHEAVSYGFADMVVDIKPKSFEMATNIKKETSMSNIINSLHKVIAMVNKTEYVNQTYTDTESGQEIEIYQADSSVYKEGDRTSIEEGVITLSDGAKVTIQDFIITEIDRSVEKGGEEEASFNEGPSPKKEEMSEEVAEEEVAPVETIQEVIEQPTAEEPKKVIEKTESTVTTKEVQAVEKVEPEAKVEEEVEAKCDEEMKAKEVLVPDAKYTEMVSKIEALEKQNEDLVAKFSEMKMSLESGGEDFKAKFEQVNKFQEVAAKAIDTVASSMQSNFKPEAKSSVGLGASGSIFQQLKVKAGLN